MSRDTDYIRHHYEVLDLEPSASSSEVEQAYREMAKVWHPDRFPDDARLRKRAEQKMKDINKARDEILSHLGSDGARASRPDGGETPRAARGRTADLRLPHQLLKYGIPVLLLLLAGLSRLPSAMVIAVLVLVAVILLSPRGRG